jgi:hypothetical protein
MKTIDILLGVLGCAALSCEEAVREYKCPKVVKAVIGLMYFPREFYWEINWRKVKAR